MGDVVFFEIIYGNVEKLELTVGLEVLQMGNDGVFPLLDDGLHHLCLVVWFRLPLHCSNRPSRTFPDARAKSVAKQIAD